MKRIIASLLLSVLAVSTYAQDRIITSNKDTIQCKIVTIGTTKIFYEQNEGNKIAGKAINLDDVAGYYRDAKSTVNTSNTVYVNKQIKQRIAPAYPWVLGVSVGTGHLPYMIQIVPDNERADEHQDLKNGFQLNINLHYLFSKFMGVGVQYSLYGAEFNGERIRVLDQTYPMLIGAKSKERQYINYVGPSVLFQQFLGSKHKFQLSEMLSGGMLSYRLEEQLTVDIPAYPTYNTQSYNILARGLSMAGSLGLLAEYYVFPYLSVGIGGSFMYGMVKKISMDYKNSEGLTQQVSNQEISSPLDLTRFDYSLVLRFHL